MYCKYFLLAWGLAFHFLDNVFWRAEVYFDKVKMKIYSMLFMSYLISFCLSQDCENFLLSFILEVLVVAFVCKFLIHLELNFMYDMK